MEVTSVPTKCGVPLPSSCSFNKASLTEKDKEEDEEEEEDADEIDEKDNRDAFVIQGLAARLLLLLVLRLTFRLEFLELDRSLIRFITNMELSIVVIPGCSRSCFCCCSCCLC